jgi:hypothetical protein
MRKLQRRLEREWREYTRPPEITVGPFRGGHSARKTGQVYRSIVQIHFHKDGS